MKEIIKKNWFELLLMVIGGIVYFYYNLEMHVELPFETYMERTYIIEKFYEGTLTLRDLLQPISQGGMLGTYLLFLINLKFFHFSVFFENFVNIINVIIVGSICIWGMKKTAKNNKGIVYILSCVVATMFLYTWMQERCGGMSTQVRLSLLSFIVVSTVLDKEIRKEKHSIGSCVVLAILIALSVNVFGMLYGFAGIPGIIMVCLFTCITDKKINSISLVTFFTYLFTLVLYKFEYNASIEMAKSDSTPIMSKIASFFVHPIDSLHSIAGWCGSTVLGHACLEDGYINESQYFIVGIIMAIIFMVSFVAFFKIRMYEETWLPFLFYAYFVILFAEIYVGRPGGLGWFTNSWYLVHGKVAIVATIWIWEYAFFNRKRENDKKFAFGVIVFNIIIAVMLCIGSYYVYIRLPYEKVYLEQAQVYLFAEDISELPVDESGMTPLLKGPELSMQSIEVYKKYGLSLYRDYDRFLEMQKITGRYNDWGSTIDTCYLKDGIGSDFMAQEHAEIKIRTQAEGRVVINITWIQEVLDRDVILEVRCNGEQMTSIQIDNVGPTEYSIDNLPKNEVVTIELDTDDSRQVLPDVRNLSYRLNDVYAY